MIVENEEGDNERTTKYRVIVNCEGGIQTESENW